MIELTLPYPVSANRYWRTVWPNGARCPVTTVSAQARAYRTQVRRLALEAGVSHPFSGRVGVSFVLFPRRPSDWKRRAKADPVHWDDSVQCKMCIRDRNMAGCRMSRGTYCSSPVCSRSLACRMPTIFSLSPSMAG